MSVVFRFAEEADAPGIQAIYAPFCESSTVSFETVAPSVEEMAQRIGKVSRRLPWLVCELGARIAGYVYASPHRERAAYQWSVDVAVYVDPHYWRAGVGRGLYVSLFGILAHLGYFKVYAGVTLPNFASVGLHKAVGFEPVGVYRGVGFKLGNWHDVSWWQKALQAEVPSPTLPLGISEVIQSTPVQRALQEGLSLVRV